MGVPTNDIIECAVQSLGLNDVTPFVPNEKIIDFAVKRSKRPLISLANEDFLNECSTNSPAPGGGSVAAMAGSLGASLASMVAALTHEKKDMLDSKPEMDIIGIEAQLLKDQLAFLVDEDTEAFNQVMSANRLPSSNENEKIKKSQSVELANQYAIDVPMETAELCFKVLKLANQLVDNGNPNSVSDAGVAGELALAGVRGACMNVLINLPSVDDLKYKNEKKEAVEKLKKDAEQLHAIIHQQTNEKIEE